MEKKEKRLDENKIDIHELESNQIDIYCSKLTVVVLTVFVSCIVAILIAFTIFIISFIS